MLLNGETGKVAFDDNGDRINAEYDVVNVQASGKQFSVGTYFHNSVSIRSFVPSGHPCT